MDEDDALFGNQKQGKWKNLFKCIVPGCRSSTITKIAKLHSFPWRDMPRAQKWIRAVGCLELLGAPPKALLRLRVCDIHFDKKLKRGKNMKLFDNSAVPTLKLDSVKKPKVAKRRTRKVKKESVAETEADCATDTEPSDDTAPAGANGAAAAPQGANGAPEAAHSVPNGANGATQTPIRVPRELARFLTLREKLLQRNTARKGYDNSFAVFALNLHLSCPSAYRALRRSLRLPPPALLARADLGLGTRPARLLEALQAKLERATPQDRECALCLDEVELTARPYYVINKDELVGFEEVEGSLRAAPATRALLLVARSLRGVWTQPLGYYYLAEDTDVGRLVAPLRDLVLRALPEAGCRVRAVLAALGPTFGELARALGAGPESPGLRDSGVSFLHDPDQLLLTLRDTLVAYDIKYRDPDTGAELRASWRHVVALRDEDRARPLRLLPELTRARIRPAGAGAARVRHASAVFTRRVAGHMGAARAGTARLLALVGALRSALTARTPRPGGAADALAAALADMRIVSAEGEEHHAEVFARALRLTLTAVRQRGAPHAACDLRPVRRFVERAEGARGRLAPRDFRARFRRWAMRCLVREGRPRSERGDHLAGLLRRAEGQGPRPREPPPALSVAPLEHRAGASAAPGARRGAGERAADALLRELSRAHGCAAFAAWSQDGARFRRLFRSLDTAFRRLFSASAPNAVASRAVPALGSCLTGLPCACFPRDALLRLFVRFRIHAGLLAYRSRPAPDVPLWLFPDGTSAAP